MSKDVLIAEIPKAGPRWGQGNYPKPIMKDFFEVKPGVHASNTKTFGWITNDGAIKKEIRSPVRRKSKNYGFELGAAGGVSYPSGSKRPIAIFRKLSSGKFHYQLLLPGDTKYDAVNKYLQSNYTGSKRQRPRITVPSSALKSIWPGSPLL